MSWLAAWGLFTSRCRECRAIFETICGWQVSCYVWILQSNTYRIKMASLEFWMTTTGNHGNSWNDDYLLCLKLWLEVVSVLWSQSEFCMNSDPAVNVRPGCSAPQRATLDLSEDGSNFTTTKNGSNSWSFINGSIKKSNFGKYIETQPEVKFYGYRWFFLMYENRKYFTFWIHMP